MIFDLLEIVQNQISNSLMNHFNIHTQKVSGVSESMTPIGVSKSQFNPVYEAEYFWQEWKKTL